MAESSATRNSSLVPDTLITPDDAEEPDLKDLDGTTVSDDSTTAAAAAAAAAAAVAEAAEAAEAAVAAEATKTAPHTLRSPHTLHTPLRSPLCRAPLARQAQTDWLTSTTTNIEAAENLDALDNLSTDRTKPALTAEQRRTADTLVDTRNLATGGSNSATRLSAPHPSHSRVLPWIPLSGVSPQA
eukprot:scaffold20431_cov75-Phaeocystis_antarctica.AAC.1